MGGMVLETNIGEVVTHVEGQNKMEKSEASPTMSIKVSKLDHSPLDCRHDFGVCGLLIWFCIFLSVPSQQFLLLQTEPCRLSRTFRLVLLSCQHLK